MKCGHRHELDRRGPDHRLVLDAERGRQPDRVDRQAHLRDEQRVVHELDPLPAAMSCGPPESAASSTRIPRSAPAAVSSSAVTGSEVVCWMSVAPGFMAAMAPSGPS